jgi:hypothetical protein
LKTVIDKDKTEGKFPVNISKGIDRILIHYSLVENSYLNNVISDVIYSFVPETPPGSLITVNPNPPIYLPVREKKFIQTIRMQITDQENRLLELNNEPVTYIVGLGLHCLISEKCILSKSRLKFGPLNRINVNIF